MENIEKATQQLTGRVTQSQKEYFNSLEGSFAEKVEELIELHKNKVVEDEFTVSQNLETIQKAIDTILANIRCIEANANTYVVDFKGVISKKIEEVENESIELKGIRNENEELEKVNSKLVEENIKLKEELENHMKTYKNLMKTYENNENIRKHLTDDNNKLLQYKLNTKEELQEIKDEYEICIRGLKEEIASKDSSVSDLDKKLLLAESKRESLNEKVKEYREDGIILKNKIDSLTDEIQQVKLEKQKIEFINSKEIESKDKVIEELRREIEDLKKPKGKITTKPPASKQE